MKTINVAYRSLDEKSRKLSNLSERKFEYDGRNYRSVEHAYQTLKSGEFDEVAYKSSNIKPRSLKRVDKTISYSLMVDLIYESFKQNMLAYNFLRDNHFFKEYEFTHTIDRGYWKLAFPKALKEALDMLYKESIDFDS